MILASGEDEELNSGVKACIAPDFPWHPGPGLPSGSNPKRKPGPYQAINLSSNHRF